MLFNSWEFAALVVMVLPLYYLPLAAPWRRTWQVTLLLVASAVFYAWEDARLLPLLAASCGLNAVAVQRILGWKSAALMEKRGEVSEGGPGRAEARARGWMRGAVFGNLLLLAAFKYAGFLLSVVPGIPIGWREAANNVPLPVGISFYTFQGISLVVDTWRGSLSVKVRERLRREAGVARWRDLSFYIGFFPQLVAGPIVKAREFVGQIGAKRWTGIDWTTVRRCLIGGYFLKVFVADNLAEQTAALTLGPEVLETMGPLILLPLLYGYSIQIFADFAGYSLIAIGLGALFGYRLPENFRFPYLSTSVTEFWRRWHLSLSSWLRDYLYIPLGGNREGVGRTYFNLFVVMFLGGLWHGASWKFAIWGILHGGFLAAERFLSRRRGKVSEIQTLGSGCAAPKRRGRFICRSLLGWCFTFHVVTLLWLTFLMPDMESVFSFFKGVFSGNTFLQGPPIFALMVYGSAVVAYHAWGWLHEHRGGWASRLQSSVAEPLVHGLMIFLMVSNPGAPKGFIYFQF